MATITQKITIDVARANVFSAIIGKQFDTDSRFLKCTLAQEGVAMEIESGVTVSINARRPDNTTSSFAGERNADGTVTVPIDEWILEQNGMVSLSVSIVSASGEKLTSCTFYLNVQQAEGEGWLWVYTATGVVATGTYHINFGGTNYQFTLPTALESGDKIYFSSALDYAKSVEPTGAEIDTMILTVGSGGTALVSSELINFLASLESELASYNSRVESVEDALDTKADKSGEFEDLTAGTANAVIDKDSYSLSTTPYLHRISPSGKRCEMDIIGGTVGWNQLISIANIRETRGVAGGSVLFTNNGDGSVTITGTATTYAADVGMWRSYSQAIATHKYFVGSFDEQILIGGTDGVDHGKWAINNGTTYNVTLYPKLIDLTTLLGSTIADYAYSLEQATAGSGIAWLKSFGFLTKSYYPFSEPTLESVQATARKAVGINKFDASKAVENARWTASGSASSSGTTRSDYIPCIPNTDYYFKNVHSTQAMSSIYWFTANKEFISSNAIIGSVSPISGQATSPSNAYYVGINLPSASLDTCVVNISNPTINGQYFPYESHTYPLSNITLRGIPKLDSSNNIYYDGDKYKADGSVQRRYGVVDLGTLNWSIGSTNQSGVYRKNAPLTGAKIVAEAQDVANIVCSKYLAVNALQTYRAEATGIAINVNSAQVLVYDPNYNGSTDIATFKASLSGVYLVYELATPTNETADKFTPIQYTGSTESFSTDNDVPVGVEAKYYTDLTLPTLPTANGTYTLKCTVTDGTGIVSWVSE